MRVGDVARHIFRYRRECIAFSQGINQVEEHRDTAVFPRYPETADDQDHAEKVEQRVCQRRLTGGTVGGDRRQLGGDRGSEVGTEDESDGGVKVDQSAGAEDDHDTGGRGRTLHDQGRDQTDKDGSHKIAERHDPIDRSAVKHLEKFEE